MNGVAPEVWDFCAVYIAWIWNRIPRRKGKLSPFEYRYGRRASLRMARRFGCLAYSKIMVSQGPL